MAEGQTIGSTLLRINSNTFVSDLSADIWFGSKALSSTVVHGHAVLSSCSKQFSVTYDHSTKHGRCTKSESNAVNSVCASQ